MSLDDSNDSAYFVEDDGPLTQPYDERKSRVPYVKGSRFTVRQHAPPPVKLDPYTLCTFEYKNDSIEMELLPPIERCLQYPPLPGSYGSFRLELQICDTLRIGDCHHAQVVVVEVLTANPPGLSQGQRVVAKFYDPMYINDDEFNVNPFLAADKDYTHETAAYQALSDFQGSRISQFYGTYSLDTPLEQREEKRCVRLTLIEFPRAVNARCQTP